MAYRWLHDLDVALDRAGVPYTEVGPSSLDPTGATSWRNRGRPASTGDFDVCGIVCHHTASPIGTTAQADLNVILAGNGSAPGPISQFLCDRTGKIWLVAAGRGNHAGSGKRPGIDTHCTDQNALNIGIEASNNGVGERWPDAMTDAYGRLVAALCAHYGWPLGAVYLHATTGPPSGGCNSKIDPAGPWAGEPHLTGSTTWDLNAWRAYCAERWPGTPEEDEMTDADFQRIAQIVAEQCNANSTKWVRSAEFKNVVASACSAALGTTTAGMVRDTVNGVATTWVRSAEFNAVVEKACAEALAAQ